MQFPVMQSVMFRCLLKKVTLGSCLLFIISCASTPTSNPNDSVVAQSPIDNIYVELSFDINEAGKPINVQVTNASPKRIFDNAAIKEVSSWKYKPKLVDGVAVVQKDLEVRLDFKKDESSVDKL
jgi:protein TonB